MYSKDINITKRLLREKYFKKRKSKDSLIKKTNDQLILNKLFSFDKYKKCNTVFMYMSKPDEISTYKLFEKALFDKKTVALPRCIEGKKELQFFKVNSLTDLEEGKFKILEPKKNICSQILSCEKDLCVVPGISFDMQGYRLGYGGGYYDRFLTEFKGNTVGLCYEDLIVSVLPKDKFDIAVDTIITENRIIFK